MPIKAKDSGMGLGQVKKPPSSVFFFVPSFGFLVFYLFVFSKITHKFWKSFGEFESSENTDFDENLPSVLIGFTEV